MSAATSDLTAMIGKRWEKPPLIKRDWLRWGLAVCALVYLVAVIG